MRKRLIAGCGVATLVVATMAWSHVDRSARADAAPHTASTPVMSARRVPGLVLGLERDPVVAEELRAVSAQSPPQSCLEVEVDGRKVFGHDVNTPLAPASNQKLLTARLALDLLGRDYRYHTVVTGPEVTSGVVRGNLYLVGGGDPVLETDAYLAHFKDPAAKGTSLEKLADEVVARGVRQVTGSVMGDESRYDSRRDVPVWPDRYLEQHQLGPLSALEVNQSFTSFPDTFSDQTLDQLVAAPNPPMFAAQTFAELLRRRGVRIDGRPGVGKSPAGTPEIATISSPPLSNIIAQMLRRSDNQIAELLVKEIGRTHGAGGTTAAGLAVFSSKVTGLGVPTTGIVMHDGSGLDRDDRLTCALLSALLSGVGPDSPIGDGLAVGGRSGTLRERFTAPAVAGRITAKTGTLNDVSALSGFAAARHGPTLVFSYIANGATISEALLSIQDRLADVLVGYAGNTDLAALGPR